MHACNYGYDRYTRDWEGASAEYLPFQHDAFRTVVYEDARSILDTCVALVCHGVFERNPGVRIGVEENGGSWVPRLVDLFRRVRKKMAGEFASDPVEQFTRHVWNNPFHEDDLAELVDLVGVDRVMFGSDFPHPEGLAEPATFLHEVESLGEPAITKIMGSNLVDLLEPRPYAA